MSKLLKTCHTALKKKKINLRLLDLSSLRKVEITGAFLWERFALGESILMTKASAEENSRLKGRKD